MVQTLPIHIINEIERRWLRRLDARSQTKPAQSKDRSVGPCPLCKGPAATEMSIPGNRIVRE